MERKIKEEVQKVREEQKEKLNRLYSKDQILPEVEHLVESVEVHELEDSIVTITGINPMRMASAMGMFVGANAADEGNEDRKSDVDDISDHEHDDSEAEEAGPELKLKPGSVKIAKKALATDITRTMRRFNAFKQKMSQEKKKKSKASKAAKLKREKVREKIGKRKNRPNSRPAHKRQA